MKKNYTFLIVAFLIIGLSAASYAGDSRSLTNLLLENERNPQFGRDAKRLADRLGLPRTVYLESGILIDALAIESGKPLYAVISNLAHPFEGGQVLFYEQVAQQFDLTRGIINPTRPTITDPNWKDKLKSREQLANSNLLLVPDWTADKVMAFDPVTGNLVDTAFIRSNPVALASPKEARLSPRQTITVSDQITDLVQSFTTAGAYISHFAPAGGVNTSLLDNIRGHAYRPNGRLLVTVASGANQNCIAEFDSAGNYIGQFIPPSSNGPNSPFAILIRSSDLLVTTSSAPIGVIRFDLAGGYLGLWASITSFPQQIAQVSRDRLAIANFSGTGQTGVRLYTADGTFIRLLSGVTGNRGVFELGNGNFLTTNGAGIHELDTSGTLLRTIATGTNMQYINLIERTGTNVEEEPSVPVMTSLFQNYPNPFNPSTTIRYTIATSSFVQLVVYDVLGREVATLVNETKDPGSYDVEFSPSVGTTGRLSSGIFFYQLIAGGRTQTRKLMVLQ